jgi:hypothetical protein
MKGHDEEKVLVVESMQANGGQVHGSCGEAVTGCGMETAG